MPAPRTLPALAAVLTLGLTLTACGKDEPESSAAPASKGAIGGKAGSRDSAAASLVGLATKNTTRVPGGDPVALAAEVAQAVYTGGPREARPPAVALVDRGDWQGALAASVLGSSPLRAPVLLSDGTDVPTPTRSALAALDPTGAEAAGDAQVVRIGDVPRPARLRTTDVAPGDPFAMAAAIDALQSAARGATSERVVVVSADDPAYAMPAAAWAAKSGDPILFVRRNEVPAATRKALERHQQPKIYVLGPSSVVSPSVTRRLRALGTVTRIGAQDPVTNAIAFARFSQGAFGWGIVDPGHGFVLARASADPVTAAAGAMLSASGSYGPLLLAGSATGLDRPLREYLLDLQPGYTEDPVRGVYNRGWLLGDEGQLSARLQGEFDRILEIVPVSEKASR